MTAMMDWIRGWLFGEDVERTVVEEKTEEKAEPKELDFKSLEEQVANMQRSGCGCYRYPARALFARYSTGTPEETVQAYDILRGKIHSSCRGRSYTSSNIGTVRGALDAAYTALERAAPETRKEMLKRMGRIAYDLKCDGEGCSELFTDSHVQRLSALAAKWMKEEDYVTVMKVLTEARGIARKTQNATAAESMIRGLMTSYLPTAIAGLSKKGIAKIQDLNTVIDCAAEGKLRKPLLERLYRVQIVRAEYEDQFTEKLDDFYARKIYPIEKTVEGHNSENGQYCAKKRALEQKITEHAKGCDQNITYLQRTKDGTKDEYLLCNLDKMIGARVAEKSAYQTEMQEQIAAVDSEKDAAIQPLQQQIDSLKQSLDCAVEHYNAGTMTRAEYKAIDHEMRRIEWEMKKK